MQRASIAALFSALLCYPRLALWAERHYPIWYLEGVVFVGSIVLWAFVFAWHERYARRSPFTLNIHPNLILPVAAFGVIAAVLLHFCVDPQWRALLPMDYPKSVREWLAGVGFSLAFTHLFLVFAPFAWLMRLSKSASVSMGGTILLVVFVSAIKLTHEPAHAPNSVLLLILAAKACIASVSVWLYQRNGVIPVWMLGLLIESRHLVRLITEP